MADGDLLVTISGAALSLLFYENVRSVGDQMGFLLGEVLEFMVKTYTDSDNQVETIKTHINVETIVTCPLSALFSESEARISKEKLKDFMRDKSKQVIGWFRFRRNTNSLIPSLRDKLLHKEFAAHFSDLSENGCKKDFFLTCLLNASTSETRGTHKFRHVFLRHKRGMFEPIPLRINNLGDDASRHDGSDYKPTPVRKHTSLHASDDFSKLIESLKLDMNTNGLESAMFIQRFAEQHLTLLIPKVRESDLEVAELERQVRDLKAKVKAQLIKNSKVNGENCEKTNRRNCLLERPESSMKSDMKISDNAHFQRELSHPISLSRNRNTAALIVESVNQDKSRRMGISNQDNNQAQGTQDFLVNNRRPIPEITSEPICQEDSEACMGRGRGRGRGNHEFTPGMKKARHNSGMLQMHSSRERSTTSPEQENFADVECPGAAPLSPSVPRCYSQTARKTSVDKCNTMTSLDI